MTLQVIFLGISHYYRHNWLKTLQEQLLLAFFLNAAFNDSRELLLSAIIFRSDFPEIVCRPHAS